MVYVLNKNGRPLMPCSSRKARMLLSAGKAAVVKRTPFVIRLVHGSSGYVQAVTLGVDSGFTHVGLSAVTGTKIEDNKPHLCVPTLDGNAHVIPAEVFDSDRKAASSRENGKKGGRPRKE